MKKKKIFRQKISFSKAELIKSSVELGAIGISMPIDGTKDYAEEFSTNRNWLAQLGSLFGSVNDPKFYDGVTAHSVIPKEEDFVKVPFRLLSATTVGAGTWKATDFSNEKVLKASMKKLEGKPLYKDHETDLDNWVGIVEAVKWAKPSQQGGVNVPAGIDGLVAIDAKTNPKIARGVLLGSIFSNSVTVDFQWEMSHEFEDEYDFYNKVGTIGDDGKMVRRVVVDINDYYESSLVWLGADPFAKAVKEDGELTHIDVSSVYNYAKQSFSKHGGKEDLSKYQDEPEEVIERLKSGKKMVINFGLEKNVLPLAQRKKKSNFSSEEEKNKDMNKLIAAFIAAFGQHFNLQKGDTLTEEQMIEHLGKLTYSSQEHKDALDLASTIREKALDAFKKDNPDATEVDIENFLKEYDFVQLSKFDALKQEKEDLSTQVESLTKMADVGKQFISQKRDEAIRLYRTTVGEDNVDEAVVSLFKEAGNEAIDGLLKQYTKGATAKFSGKCSKCGSHDFTFQSSFDSGKDDKKEDREVRTATTDDFRAKYGSSFMGQRKED